MKEYHFAPLATEGPFHTGKLVSFLALDAAVRSDALMLREKNAIRVVSDSWNQYGYGGSIEDARMRAEDITARLDLIPGYELEIDGSLNAKTLFRRVSFVDSDSSHYQLVNGMLHEMRRKGYIVPGIIYGKKGLYLDTEKILEDIGERDELYALMRTYPARIKKNMSSALRDDVNRNYVGKLPLTKMRSEGIMVDRTLLESDVYYIDSRFSPELNEEVSASDTDRLFPVVSPLVTIAMMPLLQRAKDETARVTFMTNHVANLLRVNLMACMLSWAMGYGEPYQRLHTFNHLNTEAISLTSEEARQDPYWMHKARFVVFNNMSQERKVVGSSDLGHDSENRRLKVLEMSAYLSRIRLIYGKLQQDGVVSDGVLTDPEIQALNQIGILKSLVEMDYSGGFRKLKTVIAERSRRIMSGISPLDSGIVKTSEVFLPHLLERV